MQRLRKQLRTEVRQQVTVDPRTFVASKLTQSTAAEVRQLIEAELQQNPALEWLDSDDDRIEEEEIYAALLPQDRLNFEQSHDSYKSIPRDETDDYWWNVVGDQPSLTDHLLAQLKMELESDLHVVAEYIVFSLDERGYLSDFEEEIALQTGRSIDEVHDVISALQRCGPPGVGARSLQESLELQLQASSDPDRDIALTIVKGHFDALLKTPSKALARKLHTTPNGLKKAFQLILSLEPYPARVLKTRTQGGKAIRHKAVPDLAIRKSEQGWDVSIVGLRKDGLQVSRSYKSAQESSAFKRNSNGSDKRHVEEMVNRAETFIDAVQRRYDTYFKLGSYLIEHQQGFLDTEDMRFLRPITRAQAAKDLGIHESTLSRATKDKFVELPSGCLMPFEVFFTPALRMRRLVEEVLASESAENPLSDAKVAEILQAKGIEIARRTVTKYRNKDRNLNSRHRKSA